MTKKYELLHHPSILRRHVKTTIMVKFIQDTFDNIDLARFRLSIELTLYICNCLHNMDPSPHEHRDLVFYQQQTIAVYETLLKAALTDEEKQRVCIDVQYLMREKMLVRIHWMYYHWVQLYNFFFQPSVYIVEQS